MIKNFIDHHRGPRGTGNQNGNESKEPDKAHEITPGYYTDDRESYSITPKIMSHIQHACTETPDGSSNNFLYSCRTELAVVA
jgi:hypothetical protein